LYKRLPGKRFALRVDLAGEVTMRPMVYILKKYCHECEKITANMSVNYIPQGVDECANCWLGCFYCIRLFYI
jgi:hypothetical protein